ncbi:MAG TPA: DHH family phosphoesterase [Acidimicrobiales bacterium]|nr:DHH family phosphoesterase [Acidimicrobiales bacterium]
MTTPDLDRAAELLRAATTVGLICHVDPDGDALGSMLALHHLCRAHGKDSVASWPEPFHVAPHYAFLPGLEDCTKPADFPDEPDVIVTFDCGSLQRLNELAVPATRVGARGGLVVLDHHVTNARYGSVNVVDPTAAATAVVVRHLADRLGWGLTREAALCLYTGLVTDTGRFQYDATCPEVFALAAELSAYDLPIASMSRQLFEEHRFAYLKLVADCLGRAELDPELGLVATWVATEDLAAHHVSIEETEGLIDLVRRAKEADVACVLKDVGTGVRVSLRSVGDVDVSTIATRFGGGGHAFAAGFTAPGSIASVLADIRSALADARSAGG